MQLAAVRALIVEIFDNRHVITFRRHLGRARIIGDLPAERRGLLNVAGARLRVGGRRIERLGGILSQSDDRDEHGNGGEQSRDRSEEHTSELQSLMRISYAVFCLKKNSATKHVVHRQNRKLKEPQTN